MPAPVKHTVSVCCYCSYSSPVKVGSKSALTEDGEWTGPSHTAGNGRWRSHFGKRWQFLRLLNKVQDPAVLLQHVYPREFKTHVHAKTRYIGVHSSIIHNNQRVRKTQCLLTDERVDGRWCISCNGISFSMRRTFVMVPATMWMNLENIMLNERSHSQKSIYYRIPFIGHIHNREIRRDRKGLSGWGMERGC